MASEPAQHQTETGVPPKKEMFPPFDARTFPSQILWFAIAFGALYLLMSRVALPRVAEAIELRRKRIDADLEKAAAMQQEAKEAGKAYERTLAEAKGKAQDLAAETRAKIKADADGKRATLEAELNGKLAQAEAQISDMKSKAMANVGEIAREATSAIVEHLTGKPVEADKVSAAVAATGK
ncbi:ATP synthase subunit b 2 [Beijerinckiaceae bacterium RH AL1]|jgi:F-type H+-transporting ATPase subunit b|nr:F0F1 ATP synthase subunit B [Beijerinckiaceae bacterium]VVB44199.1 ATP synthase subunit b 2 [Beijerinckiaceae bacterium RH CH11]VVB44227.1 ATP synthase subunit b 2 [Beijerinckiaceae bacterium RH AL8]VVC54220.1 ATP synthase subunit b 2 [Beijerinckiaceae bacterium RH AL1]